MLGLSKDEARTMAKPLDGIVVVSVEQAVAAPYCTSRLADAGARVIKVERPGGDFARDYDHVVHGESAYFVWLNRGSCPAPPNVQGLAPRICMRAIHRSSPATYRGTQRTARHGT
jgi:hypothetical protein